MFQDDEVLLQEVAQKLYTLVGIAMMYMFQVKAQENDKSQEPEHFLSHMAQMLAAEVAHCPVQDRRGQ